MITFMEGRLSSMKGRVMSRGGSRSVLFWWRLMLVTVGFSVGIGGFGALPREIVVVWPGEAGRVKRLVDGGVDRRRVGALDAAG
jgi:hypothetical protein